MKVDLGLKEIFEKREMINFIIASYEARFKSESAKLNVIRVKEYTERDMFEHAVVEETAEEPVYGVGIEEPMGEVPHPTRAEEIVERVNNLREELANRFRSDVQEPDDEVTMQLEGRQVEGRVLRLRPQAGWTGQDTGIRRTEEQAEEARGNFIGHFQAAQETVEEAVENVAQIYESEAMSLISEEVVEEADDVEEDTEEWAEDEGPMEARG
jgi:hypothetical protein